MLVEPDRQSRPQPPHEPHDRARLRLRTRSWAGVVDAAEAPPAEREVAIQVDAVRVPARARRDAVRVHRHDEPEVEPGREGQPRSRRATAMPAVSLPWIAPTTSTFRVAPGSPRSTATSLRPATERPSTCTIGGGAASATAARG